MKAPSSRWGARFSAWSARWRFALLLGFTFFYFYQGGDPNQVSRLALTRAVVERHSVDITPDQAQTIDKGGDGKRYYSDKAPGVALMLTPVWAMMNAVDRVTGQSQDNRGTQRARLHMLSFVVGGIPGVIAALSVFHTLLLFGSSRRQAGVLTAGYALGTLVFPFATVMFGHVLAASLIAAAFYLVQKWRVAGQVIDLPRAAALGFLWALSIVTEYPTGMLVAVMGIYTLSLRPQRAAMARVLGGSAIGAIVPFLGHAIFAKITYGSFAALPYKYLIDPLWLSNTGSGILGIGIPTKIGTWGALFSPYRGLFFLCPFLALVFVGLSKWWSSKENRRELWVVAALIVVYCVFDVSYFAWDGGGSTGSRHIVPAIAFFVFAIGAYARSGTNAWRLTVALVIPSIVLMYVCTAVLVQVPEASARESNPLYETILPRLVRGELHTNLQDAFYPRLRADAAYNLGSLAGLSAFSSLLFPPFLWALAYLPSLRRRRDPV